MSEVLFGFYGASFGAVVGALIAFFLARYSLKNEERKKLVRTQQIINDEFYRIYYYASNEKEFFEKQFKDKKAFKEHVDNALYEISRARSPIVFQFVNFRFLLWDAIISSGSLINLESDEIQLTNSAHENISHIFENIDIHFDDFTKKYQRGPENPEMPSEESFEIYLHMFLGQLYVELEKIQQEFEKLHKNISWINKKFSSKYSDVDGDLYDIHYPTLHVIPFPQDDEPERKTPI